MGRYYSDYRPGYFVNQRLLNEAIDPNNHACLLQTNEANALTVRLLVAAEAVERLEKAIQRENDKIDDAIHELQYTWSISQWPTGLNWATETQFYTTGSGIACPEPYLYDPLGQFQNHRLSPNFTYRNNRILFTDGQGKAFPLIEAHLAIYNFFINYGSVLDCFSGEVNRLYDLQIAANVIDWSHLARNQRDLANKHSALSNAVTDFCQNTAARPLRYRNRLIHDGLIQVAAEVIASNWWKVKVVDDPDDPNSLSNTDALVLCQDALRSLIQFVDTCYGIIFARLQAVGQPPW
jgi:hypothetical protein